MACWKARTDGTVDCERGVEPLLERRCHDVFPEAVMAVFHHLAIYPSG
jgi:hypothetical protein